MSFIQKTINDAHENNELVCICLNNIDWNRRIIGYVKNIRVLYDFELEVIDEFGQAKNIKSISLTSVKSIEVGGVYNGNLAVLHKKGFIKNNSTPRYHFAKKQDIYKKVNDLKVAKTLCTFFFDTEFAIGIVNQVTKTELFIKNITFDGTQDGISVFDIMLLTKVRSASNFENRISFLLENNENKFLLE